MPPRSTHSDEPTIDDATPTNAAQNDYQLYGTNRMSGRERSWFVRHGEELVVAWTERTVAGEGAEPVLTVHTAAARLPR